MDSERTLFRNRARQRQRGIEINGGGHGLGEGSGEATAKVGCSEPPIPRGDMEESDHDGEREGCSTFEEDGELARRTESFSLRTTRPTPRGVSRMIPLVWGNGMMRTLTGTTPVLLNGPLHAVVVG